MAAVLVDTHWPLILVPMWNVQLSAASLTAIPVLVLFVIAQRQFVEGLAQTGLKG